MKRLLALAALLPALAAAQEPGSLPPPQVEGRLQFDGKPLSETTKARARLWFRNEDSGAAHPVEGQQEVGDHFGLADLPPGRYYVNAYVDMHGDLKPPWKHGVPGDYTAGANFEVPKDRTLEIAMRRIIHLRSPRDNAGTIEGWEQPCEGKPAVAGRVPFEWDALDADAVYSYSVRRIMCPYRDMGEMLRGTTTKTRLSLALTPSAAGEFYLFTLEAAKAKRPVGLLMTRGDAGEGWDFRFRVVVRDEP